MKGKQKKVVFVLPLSSGLDSQLLAAWDPNAPVSQTLLLNPRRARPPLGEQLLICFIRLFRGDVNIKFGF